MTIWNDEETVRNVIEQSATKIEVLTKLDKAPRNQYNLKQLNQFLNKHEIDTSHFNKRSKGKTAWAAREDTIREFVGECISYSEILERLGLAVASGNYKTLKKYLKTWNVDVSHFDADKARSRASIPLIDILEGKCSNYKATTLKTRLFKTGIKSKKCEWCGITDWNGNPITFELDHINGNNKDHRLENLRVLCPNCHSQTPTWRGRNKQGV